MRILLIEWKSFGNIDFTHALEKAGHEVFSYSFSKDVVRGDAAEEEKIAAAVKECNADFVFSFNYFPVVSLACKRINAIYVSWVYDSPQVLLYSYTITYPGNIVFVFDSAVFEEFCRAGIDTVYFLPMAADADRLSQMRDMAMFNNSPWACKHDVSFVGSLYNESHDFYSRLDKITPYTRGYLEGLMKAQMNVYGVNFVKDALTPDIIEDMYKSLPMEPAPDGVESKEYLFSNYVIDRKITAMERDALLKSVASRFGLDLYTQDPGVTFEGCTNHGRVDYYDMAPYVFKNSKINLNITLRSITKGMPLRIFDIMGAGGFLLTNYQEDFLHFFTPGEDFVFFESRDDMMAKIEYYLCHETERAQIARNGFERIAAEHTYDCRVGDIINIVEERKGLL